MRCVAWNIRGIRSRGKSTAIKKVVSEKQLHVCGLVDTKHNSSVDRSIRSWWSNTNVEFMEVRSEDRGGGLILMWDANSLRRVSGVCGDRWIMISGSFGDLETQVSIILVYCPCSTESRRRVLEELIGVKRQYWGLDWVWPLEIDEAFLVWNNSHLKGFERKVWDAFFIAVVTSLWELRNTIIFEQKTPDWPHMKEKIILRVGLWSKAWKERLPYSVEDWICNWKVIRTWKEKRRQIRV
ncbi:uncharacterized protein LOC141607207 [Silene latifolia]|uniref:uncharacterized protein LOC141607207 n=1 Tax=Silene latifolia TaxID=37657 RepID=UPI003D774DB7